ncbi:MAG: hypothetical protein ACLQU2_35875 [Candidatus Binataceae bacterium]
MKPSFMQDAEPPNAGLSTKLLFSAPCYEVNVKSPTVMVINQNYDRAWKLYRGYGQEFFYNGLLAVRRSAGAQQD